MRSLQRAPIRDDADRLMQVVVKRLSPSRSGAQNDLMWALLTDVAEQVAWPVDGREQKLQPEDWKQILTAGVKRHQRVAAGVDGGFVMLGSSTSRMTKPEMTELIEFIKWFGAEHGVTWSGEPPAQSQGGSTR